MTAFTVGSGTFKIVDDPDLGDGGSALQGVATGVAYLPASFFSATSEQNAFGVWEFSVKRASGATMEILFCSDSNGDSSVGNNYNVQFSSTGSMYLRYGTTTIAGMGTHSSDDWHRIKISRIATGLFDIFVDDVWQGTKTDTNLLASDYVVFGNTAGVDNRLGLGSIEGKNSFSKTTIPRRVSFGSAIGDSITAGTGGGGTVYTAELANTIKNQIYNQAIGGATTADMISAQLDDAIESSNGDVYILGGSNDLSAISTSITTTNLQTMYEACVFAGLRVVAIHITPRTGDATLKAKIVTINDWIDANAPGPVVNTSSLGDGNYELLPAYNYDGVHMTAAGYTALAALVNEELY